MTVRIRERASHSWALMARFSLQMARMDMSGTTSAVWVSRTGLRHDCPPHRPPHAPAPPPPGGPGAGGGVAGVGRRWGPTGVCVVPTGAQGNHRLWERLPRAELLGAFHRFGVCRRVRRRLIEAIGELQLLFVPQSVQQELKQTREGGTNGKGSATGCFLFCSLPVCVATTQPDPASSRITAQPNSSKAKYSLTTACTLGRDSIPMTCSIARSIYVYRAISSLVLHGRPSA